MFGLFNSYPIIVNKRNITGDVEEKYIFVGQIDERLLAELNKFADQRSFNESVIVKHYGQSWKSKFSLSETTHGGGSDDFNFDGPETEKLFADIADQITKDQQEQKTQKTQKDQKDQKNKKDKKPIKQEDTDIFVKKQVVMKIKFVSDITVFPHDKIMEFKNKIFAVTGILPALQHLYHERFYPYKIYENGNLVEINIKNLSTLTTKISGIPVNSYFHSMKYDIKVEALDTLTILKDLFGQGIYEFDLFNLADFIDPVREELIGLTKDDSYTQEILYWGFVVLYWPFFTPSTFISWLISPSSFASQYPDLWLDAKEIQNMYSLESELLNEHVNVSSSIKDKIKSSIIAAILSVNVAGTQKISNVYIRGLFDKFELTPQIDYCMAVVSSGSKKLIMEKIYTNNPTKSFADLDPHIYKSQIDTITYRLRLNDRTNEMIYVVFYKNGNYICRTNWREEDGNTFESIFKKVSNLVNPLITKINSYKDLADLTEMQIKNTRFTEINMALFWDQPITVGQFHALKSVAEEFCKAGIFVVKNNEINRSEYFVQKGSYVFDIDRLDKAIQTTNYYEYLSNSAIKQKWYNIFEKTHVLNIYHRSSDVRLEMTSIKEQEFEIFMNHMYILFHLFSNIPIADQQRIKHDRTLLENKEQDPELYSTGRFKSSFIYSRTCQKPYQPSILTDPEYDELSKLDKKRAVRFWNYTKNIPVWYFCRQSKYPHVRFIVGEHPLGYCVPCCKINQVSDDPEDPKRIIHDVCLTNHIWLGDRKNISDSRYIMTYGKIIEEDRLCRLPEETLEPLFFDLYTRGVIDQECSMSNRGYYLVGVSQNYKYANNESGISLMSCIAKALDYTPEAFIEQVILRLKRAGQQKFETLDLPVPDLNYMLGLLSNLVNNKPIDYNYWFVTFEKIAYHYFMVNTVVFIMDSGCRLRLPSYLKTINDFFGINHKQLIVIKHKMICNPMFLINTPVYFISRVIERKLFDINSEIVGIISKIVRRFISTRKDQIDLNTINQFCENSQWKITTVYQSNGYAYQVGLSKVKNKKGKEQEQDQEKQKEQKKEKQKEKQQEKEKQKIQKDEIIIPISKSYSSIGTNELNDSYSDIVDLLEWVKEYNQWIINSSYAAGLIKPNADKHLPMIERIEPIYPLIIPQYLIKYKKIIGFNAVGLCFYCSPTDIQVSKFNKYFHYPCENIRVLRYDPIDVNRQIHEHKHEETDLSFELYNYYEYKIFLLAYLDFLKSYRNKRVRKAVMKIILTTKTDKIVSKLREIKESDQLTQLINQFAKSKDKKEFAQQFEKQKFPFDTPEPEELIELLDQHVGQFTIKGKKSDIKETPNVISGSTFSKSGKFIVLDQRLQILKAALKEDLSNPLKAHYILAGIDDRVVLYYNFTHRPTEILNLRFESLY